MLGYREVASRHSHVLSDGCCPDEHGPGDALGVIQVELGTKPVLNSWRYDWVNRVDNGVGAELGGALHRTVVAEHDGWKLLIPVGIATTGIGHLGERLLD